MTSASNDTQSALVEDVAERRSSQVAPAEAPARRGRDAPSLRVAVAVVALIGAVDLLMLAVTGIVIWTATPTSGGLLLGLLVFSLAIVAIQAARGHYRPSHHINLGAQIWRLLLISAMAALLASLAMEVFADVLPPISTVTALWLVGAGTLTAGRTATQALTVGLRRHGRLTSPTLIIGAGRVGHLAAKRLLDHPELGLTPVGFLDKEPLPPDDIPIELPVLGASWDLERVVAEHHIEHVVIAFSTAPHEVLLSLVRRCDEMDVPVSVVPRLFEVQGTRTSTEHIGALPFINMGPSRHKARQLRIKYALDRLLAGVACVMLAPLMGLLAIGVWLSLGRPIFFRQIRIGRDGQRFAMLKFRSMREADGPRREADAAWATTGGEDLTSSHGADAVTTPTSGDDRTTRFGRFMRRFSLDELPQLLNVVRGDMSLIGPRPERENYVRWFNDLIYRYPDRHRIKPGITGWAQVNGLRGETSLADRVEWDNFYVENWSWALDAKIVLRTLIAVFRPGR